MSGAALLSIQDLPPLETGGTFARHGFAVQDHVAAGFCLDMISDPSLAQVWSENQDDVTLIWEGVTATEVEFVQVKSNEMDQLWSISMLCGDGDVKAKGILEKSLQYDRCAENVRFRIVTSRSVMGELSVLTYCLDSQHRAPTTASFVKLRMEIVARLPHVTSPKGNGCEFWLERTYWMIVHALKAIHDANIIKVSKLVQAHGELLMHDQFEELYSNLLTRVFDGGLAKWDREPHKKKFVRNDIMAWFANAVIDAAHPARHGTSKALEAKLVAASLAPDVIESAISMRQRYRSSLLTPRYSDPGARQRIEGEIEARLILLKAQLDSLEISDEGSDFHNRCLAEVKAFYDSLPVKDRPPLQNVLGYMYNLADRCTHRFVRAST
ncbi:MAG: dsDNA nuclease domain-containing protein [Planctomycetota bacterium]